MVPRNWWNIQNFDEDKRWANLTLFLKDVYNILLKGFTIQDNMRGALLSVTFSVTNTDTQIKHGLSFVPSNYIIVGSSVAMIVYDGAQSSDQSFIYLKSDTQGTARIFVF